MRPSVVHRALNPIAQAPVGQPSQRYAPLQIGLHWLMSQLIAALYACIELHETFSDGSDTREAPQTWHFMPGPNVLVLALLRVLLLHDAKPTPSSIATAPCDACCRASRGGEPRGRKVARCGP